MSTHNLTATPWLRRLDIKYLKRFYEAQSYRPQTDGSGYALTLEDDNLFGFTHEDDLRILDMRHSDPTDHGEQDQQYEADKDLIRLGYDIRRIGG